jgi:uncharacterized protein (TIGR02246 family)
MATERADEGDVAAIRSLHAEWVAAIRRGDHAALADLLDADYEGWTDGAPDLRGRATAVEVMRQALSQYEIEQRFESIELLLSGTLAVDRGIESFVLVPRSGGESRSQRQRALLVLRRGTDGRWRYARGMTNHLPPEAPPAGRP